MPKISIVIVSYNVRFFLRQCLQSIYKSKVNAELEIVVTDNHSKDGSAEMLRKEFPDILLITNDSNRGFSKANNQAFEKCTGDYVLILNPDTIIEENTLQICLDKILENDDIGAIGVKMVDGAGKYLPESKRGFPTPLRAVFKLLGLSTIFKKSAYFNGYYMGHIPENKTHEIEVLTGAFMFCPFKLIKQLGGFDEDYFMYGEDIELSYQINKAGKKLIYLPTSSIIHFKGESTNKSTYKYIKSFYGAMQLYAKKRHATSGTAWNLILQLGIVLAALAGIFQSLIKFLFLPLFNFVSLFFIAKSIQYFWAMVYFKDASYYQDGASDLSISTISAILVFSFYLFGQYDKQFSLKQLFIGFIFGALLALSVYSLFPLDWRFSRSVLMIWLMLSPFIFYIFRIISNKINYNSWYFNPRSGNRILIAGSHESFQKIESIVRYYYDDLHIIGRIFDEQSGDVIGNLNDAKHIVESKNVSELIYCSKDISTETIFGSMSGIRNTIKFKIANDDNSSILGSDSKNRLGQWYTLDIAFKIDQTFHRRTKRIIDLSFSLLVLLIFPLVLIFNKNASVIYQNLLAVIISRKTWLGYDTGDENLNSLPYIKPAVFEFSINTSIKQEQIHQSNLFYARNYSIWLEMEQLFKVLFNKNA